MAVESIARVAYRLMGPYVSLSVRLFVYMLRRKGANVERFADGTWAVYDPDVDDRTSGELEALFQMLPVAFWIGVVVFVDIGIRFLRVFEVASVPRAVLYGVLLAVCIAGIASLHPLFEPQVRFNPSGEVTA